MGKRRMSVNAQNACTKLEGVEQERTFEAEKYLVNLQGQAEAIDHHEQKARSERQKHAELEQMLAEAVDECHKLAEDRDQHRETTVQHQRRFVMLSERHANAEESLEKARRIKAVDEATQAHLARCHTLRNGAETMS